MQQPWDRGDRKRRSEDAAAVRKRFPKSPDTSPFLRQPAGSGGVQCAPRLRPGVGGAREGHDGVGGMLKCSIILPPRQIPRVCVCVCVCKGWREDSEQRHFAGKRSGGAAAGVGCTAPEKRCPPRGCAERPRAPSGHCRAGSAPGATPEPRRRKGGTRTGGRRE